MRQFVQDHEGLRLGHRHPTRVIAGSRLVRASVHDRRQGLASRWSGAAPLLGDAQLMLPVATKNGPLILF
jgi:hypothetical protein